MRLLVTLAHEFLMLAAIAALVAGGIVIAKGAIELWYAL